MYKTTIAVLVQTFNICALLEHCTKLESSCFKFRYCVYTYRCTQSRLKIVKNEI